MKRLLSLTFAAAAMLSTSPAFAARYTIDADHSTVGFKVKHLQISSVAGSFGDFSGFFVYDPADPKSWKTEATVKTASIDTDQTKRDEHLKSGDFFDSEKFPAITFVSKEVTNATDKGFKLKGDLTIHGVTKSVTLDVVKGGEVKDMQGKTRAAFSATTTINRKDFGLVWNKVLEVGTIVVGDDVNITLEVEGVKEEA